MLKLLVCTEVKIRRLINNEKGEGMVGWIVGAGLTVAIVVLVQGFVDNWIGDFWDNLSGKIDDIIN